VETFVVRIWTPAPADPGADGERFPLRGLVEHVGSADRRAFRGAGELLAFLEAVVEGDEPRAALDRHGSAG
jgi:hypothetical protein